MTEQSETKAIAKRPVGALLQSPDIRARFDDVLGKRSAAFISSIITAVNSNNALKNCDPMSVVSSAMIAAAIDLPINPSLGFAHIVPYKGQAQFQIGWKGLIQLALRTAHYKTIHLTKVYDGQVKRMNQFTGDMEFIDEKTSNKVIGYLLYFKLLNGYEKYFYMTTEQCEAHGKKYSQTYKMGKGRWRDDFDAMALKTVAKMGLSKYGVLSIEMQKAIEVDHAIVDQDGNVTSFPDGVRNVIDSEPVSVSDKLRAAAEAIPEVHDVEFSDEEKADILRQEALQ